LLLQRCLAKDRKSRLDSAAAARFALDDATSGPTSGATTAAVTANPLGRRRALAAAGGGLTIAATIAAAAVWTMRQEAPVRPSTVTRFLITPPAPQSLVLSNFLRSIAISPDGQSIAYLSGTGQTTGSLMLRRFDQIDAQPIATGAQVWEAFFSPDGQWLGFVDENFSIKKVRVGGGPVLTVARNMGVVGGFSWGEDDTIVFTSLDRASGVLRVLANGGGRRS
jgi:hypothetical protein